MSAPLVNVLVGNPPPESCIPQEIIDWLQNNIFLNQSGLNNSQRILVQQFAPGPDERDTLWERISATGVPQGFFVFYNGAWRRYPTVPIGLRGYYTGPITGVFDPVTLIGLPGTEWDGWRVDLTFRNAFVVNAASFNAGTTEWETTIGGGSVPQGGAPQTTLNASNVPLPSVPALQTRLWSANGNTPLGGTRALWGQAETTAPFDTTLQPAQPGNPNPIPFSILPPYVAMAQVQFIGFSSI